jgi:hypothetical protein
VQKPSKTTVIEWLLMVVLLIGISELLSLRANAKNAAASEVKISATHPVQSKIFQSGAEGVAQLETDVNKWLREHDVKIEFICPTQSGDRYVTAITIWYRSKTD